MLTLNFENGCTAWMSGENALVYQGKQNVPVKGAVCKQTLLRKDGQSSRGAGRLQGTKDGTGNAKLHERRNLFSAALAGGKGCIFSN
jgi:hypothetical protein